MLIGTLSAIGSGASTPVSFLFLGDVIRAFTFNDMTVHTSLFLFNKTVGCDNETLVNFLFKNLSTAVTCVDNGDLIAIINSAVYKFVVVAVGTFICAYVQVFFFQTACERQLYKIRLYYYRAILRQDIGWFDESPSGELASRLSELSLMHLRV